MWMNILYVAVILVVGYVGYRIVRKEKVSPNTRSGAGGGDYNEGDSDRRDQ
jgi:hypothetical protein